MLPEHIALIVIEILFTLIFVNVIFVAVIIPNNFIGLSRVLK